MDGSVVGWRDERQAELMAYDLSDLRENAC
jgi:hypothetical protein